MNKKILKWVGGILLIMLIVLFSAPFIFKGKVEEMVVETINKNLKAKVAFESVDLSLFKSFPKATVVIKNLRIVNEAPFEGDTLFAAEDIGLRMSVLELFNGKDKPMHINGIGVRKGKASVIVNEEGVANYDIAIVDEDEKEDSKDSSPFALSLKYYTLEQFDVVYSDLAAKMFFKIEGLEHSGKGNLAENILDLDTNSKAKVSFVKDGTTLVNQVQLALKAVIGIDLNENKYTFKENEALINQLPLRFDGAIQLLETGQAYDLTFETPNSSFKNFLGLVPEAYSGDINKVETTGEFRVSGKVKGNLTDTTIPTLALILASDQASFKYPDLPKSVDQIVLHAEVKNETGLLNDTYVLLHKLAFKIDKDVFNANATIKNITENPLVSAQLNGVINLANVTKAYPVKLEKPLTGILKAAVTTHFDMQSVEKSAYQNIRNSGSLSLKGFHYETEEMAKPLEIQEAALVFNPNQVRLNAFELKTGTTDVRATGTLDNFYGFVFGKQKLKGNFTLNSNNFVVSDVLKATENTAEGKEVASSQAAAEPLKIPSFLDCTIHANAKQVLYDDLKLNNVVGTLVIREEKAYLQNMKTDVFDGKLAFDGSVSTKNAVPDFDMTLGLNNLDIAKSFTGLGFLKAVAPIAGIVNGKINSTVKLNGKLDGKDLSPVMSSLSGDLLGQLLSTQLSPENSKLMSALTQQINFIDLKKLSLDNIKAHLVFKDGRVQVKPFDIKYQDILVEVGGEHGFDKSMNYNLNIQVPPKYLGNEVAGVLSKLSPNEVNKLKAIPVKVGLSGSFDQPKVTTDMKSVVTSLTNQIVAEQKDKLINQGTNALQNLLGGNKNKKGEEGTNEGDKGAKEDVKEEVINKVGQGLKDLFGKNKKE